MSKAADALKRQKELAAKRAQRPEKPSTPKTSPLDSALQQSQSEFPERMPLLLSTEQHDRIKRLAYEHGIKKVEVVRRMIDAYPDDQLVN